MTNNSTDELLNFYCSKFGTEKGKIYYHAKAEWTELTVKWSQYENLFGHSEERVELMNFIGASFFGRVEHLYLESTMLAICRLSDSAKNTLSLKRFLGFFSKKPQSDTIKKLVDDADKASKFARDWRNRHIAHNNFVLKMNSSESLDSATRNKINAAIEAIYQVLLFVSKEFLEQSFDKKGSERCIKNEMNMLHYLWLGRDVVNRACEEDAHEEIWRNKPNWLDS